MANQDLDGFLSSSIEKTIEETRSVFEGWFLLCEEVNRHAHRILTSIKLNTKDLQQIYLTSVLIRAIGTFQGLIILCERGFAAQSRMILRCLMELLFLIRASSQHRELVEEIVKEDKKTRLKLHNKLKACSERTRQDLIGFPDDDFAKTLKSEIDESQITEIKTCYIAQKAGLSDYYNTAYAFLSQSVHTKIGDLDEHLKVDEKGEIVSFHLGPEIKNTGMYLLSAIECMFLVFDTVINMFKMEPDPVFDDLVKRFKKLADELKKENIEAYHYL